MDSLSAINVEVSGTSPGNVLQKEKGKEKVRQVREKESPKEKERTKDRAKVALCAGPVKRWGIGLWIALSTKMWAM